MPSQNPLSSAPVNAYGDVADPPGAPKPWETERRVQELLNEWLRKYFSGAPFDTKSIGGGALPVQFQHCDLLFGTAPMPSNPPRPVIHGVVQDITTTREDRRDGYNGHRAVFLWNFYVRVSAQGQVEAVQDDVVTTVDSEVLCRRVASQLRDLIDGTEKQALAERGVSHFRVLRGPLPISSGQVNLRQLILTHQTFYELPNPDRI